MNNEIKTKTENQDYRHENNSVSLFSRIVSRPEYSHVVYGEKFYSMLAETSRASGSADTLSLIVSERLIDIDSINVGDEFFVENSMIRSFNKRDENGKSTKLILNVFVTSLIRITNDNYIDYDSTTNNVHLVGYFCKNPTYRTTPLGRGICDMLIAVNRPYGKSDYIPCIAWGRSASYIARNLQVGDKIEIFGRFQSREYEKKTRDDDGNVISTQTMTAYEVSVNTFTALPDNNHSENNEN